MKHFFILSFVLLFYGIETHGQTIVEVIKPAYLKYYATRDSDYCLKMKVGDKLTLLSDEKKNGYFFVQFENCKGYIYKTLVKFSESSSNSPYATIDGKTTISILDTGPGMCTIIRTPSGKHIIYDAGYWSPRGFSFSKISELIPSEAEIELMVLSHTDGDHISAAAEIVKNYFVKQVLNTGYERSHLGENQRAGYTNLLKALAENPRTKHINLHEKDSIITPGTELTIDGVKFTFLCGFGEPLSEWNASFADHQEWRVKSLKINSVSIVMKMEFNGVSILFCGDAVGRRINGPEDQLIGTEKWLLENAEGLLKNDIVIAPHHGANNGSSMAFIEATRPETVVFSAGHDHGHPSKEAVNRYLKLVDVNNIYRTDRGDNEGGSEWNNNSSQCKDPIGDDDISIIIERGEYSISYRRPNETCSD